MIVGKKKKNNSKFISDRSRRSLDYAISKIKNSPVSSYVSNLYLYGSCARHEETYKSDVDLFLEINETAPLKDIRDELIILKGAVTPTKSNLPEVDLKIVIGDKWKSDNMLYYKNIKREGVSLWDRK